MRNPFDGKSSGKRKEKILTLLVHKILGERMRKRERDRQRHREIEKGKDTKIEIQTETEEGRAVKRLSN